MKKMIFLCFLIAAASPLMAAPGESSAINGAEDWMAGALPPPGFHYLNYSLYYYADDFVGPDGDPLETPPFTDFEAQVVANVFRPIYVANLNILGATPAWHLVVPAMFKDLESDFFEDDVFGLGDIYFSPLILGWHTEKIHWAAGLDIIAPTGHYDAGDVANVGVNHWTFEPAAAVSYLGSNGLTASVKVMYDIHTENTDTDVITGQQIHADWNIGAGTQEWMAGLAGYVLKGITEDEMGGVGIEDSEEQAVAIGPAVMWRKGKLALAFKSEFEFGVENRPEGIWNWIKVIYSF